MSIRVNQLLITGQTNTFESAKRIQTLGALPARCLPFDLRRVPAFVNIKAFTTIAEHSVRACASVLQYTGCSS